MLTYFSFLLSFRLPSPVIVLLLLFLLVLFSRMNNGEQFGSLARANLGKAEEVCQARRGDSDKQIFADDENNHNGGAKS